ncbi:palmitoyl-protein thioesterase 1-like isoform X3 [Palaemon carinicauda]|uniref:palmitoyl-protein thioesterase 1-like isoform X3 n=1 Tax=Palaemon carinicauda TaxID=392227 RepID=UPI0035B67888
MKWIGYIAILFASSSVCKGEPFTPLVMWHGLRDTCCSNHMIALKSFIEMYKPGIYIRSIMIGEDIEEDREYSFYGNLNDQVEEVCHKLASDPKLQKGYHAMGFSQGGLLFHIQQTYVVAQYWHDPIEEDKYRQHSIFLADINNEKEINETYRENLQKLENFVMVKFLEDTTVYPNESQWFGFYASGQNEEVLPLRETRLYEEDRLGLKEMDEAGKLHFLSVEADHLRFGVDWFFQEIVNKFVV